MRITRTFVFGVLSLLLNAVEVKANASLYSHHWHRDSHLSVTYSDRISRSRTSLALKQNRGWSLLSNDRKRLCLNSTPPRSFDRMKPTEKIVAGTVQVLANVIEDYIIGFCIGLTAGAIFELPRALLYSSGERAGNELSARAFLWARQTGEFLGCFRGCATTVRLIRSPRRDDWNLVYGCASAGAIIGRNRK